MSQDTFILHKDLWKSAHRGAHPILVTQVTRVTNKTRVIKGHPNQTSCTNFRQKKIPQNHHPCTSKTCYPPPTKLVRRYHPLKNHPPCLRTGVLTDELDVTTLRANLGGCEIGTWKSENADFQPIVFELFLGGVAIQDWYLSFVKTWLLAPIWTRPVESIYIYIILYIVYYISYIIYYILYIEHYISYTIGCMLYIKY